MKRLLLSSATPRKTLSDFNYLFKQHGARGTSRGRAGLPGSPENLSSNESLPLREKPPRHFFSAGNKKNNVHACAMPSACKRTRVPRSKLV